MEVFQLVDPIQLLSATQVLNQLLELVYHTSKSECASIKPQRFGTLSQLSDWGIYKSLS